MEQVDDDGSGMLEFEEFLKIIRGNPAGSKKKDHKDKHKGDSEASGAIYQFFRDLTDDKLDRGNPNVPFSLYISQERRRRIL